MNPIFIAIISLLGLYDASGLWKGQYDDHTQDGTTFSVPFEARLAQQDNQISGSIVEPNTFTPKKGTPSASTVQPPQLSATVYEGRWSNSKIQFRKQYNGEGGYSHSIGYSGVLDPAQRTISGYWMTDGRIGQFTMTHTGPLNINFNRLARLGPWILILMIGFWLTRRRKDPPSPTGGTEVDIQNQIIH